MPATVYKPSKTPTSCSVGSLFIRTRLSAGGALPLYSDTVLFRSFTSQDNSACLWCLHDKAYCY